MHYCRLASLALAASALALPSLAHAAPKSDASASVALGTDGAAANADADADANTDAKSRPWIRRYSPRAHMWEVGVFGGLWLPADNIELHDRNLPPIGIDTSAELGFRAGYYPLRHLGLEGELAMMPTRVETEQRAFVSSARAQVVAQLGLFRIVPFVTLGGGVVAIRSEDNAAGRNGDEMLSVGGGLKYFATDHIVLRLEGRDMMSPKEGASPNAPAHSGEVLFGFSLALGPRKPKAEPAPLDSDGDGFIDSADTCPKEAGIAPDGCPARDADNDGFLDAEDACPDVAGAAPDGCPIPDTDGDGFLDPDDACPQEPGVEPDGCPIRDTDGDGFLDPQDTCPQEPETVNGFEDEDGCPDDLPDEVKKYTGVVDGIYFATGKSKIRPRSFPKLDAAIKVLTEYSELRVEVSGHTDSRGRRNKNIELSQARADAVKQYMIDKGIDAARIETRGAGPDEPVGDNETDAGRSENRRIEFKLITATSAAQPEPAAAEPAEDAAEPADSDQ